MTWNYRVAERQSINVLGEGMVGFVIVEAYYDHGQEPDGRPDAIVRDATYPWGQDVGELINDLMRMHEAFKRPVIDCRDYVAANEDSDCAELKEELRELRPDRTQPGDRQGDC